MKYQIIQCSVEKAIQYEKIVLNRVISQLVLSLCYYEVYKLVIEVSLDIEDLNCIFFL